MEAKAIKEVDEGAHTIFTRKAVDAGILTDKEPMTYTCYLEIKRGVTPKTAPTCIKEEKKGGDKMAKYRCIICGYVYNPEKGDPESGIQSGTPFEELPDDWVCPICGAKKDQFEKAK